MAVVCGVIKDDNILWDVPVLLSVISKLRQYLSKFSIRKRLGCLPKKPGADISIINVLLHMNRKKFIHTNFIIFFFPLLGLRSLSKLVLWKEVEN